MTDLTYRLSKKCNRGEWSELFVLVCLIFVGEIEEITEGVSFIVRKIHFVTTGGQRFYCLADNHVRVEDEDDGGSNHDIFVEDWLPKLRAAWKIITAEGNGAAFQCVPLMELANILSIRQIKSPSNKKDDIGICFDSAFENDITWFQIKAPWTSPSAIINATYRHSIFYEIYSRMGTRELNDICARIGLKDKKIKGGEIIPGMISAGNVKMKFLALRDPSWELGTEGVDIFSKIIIEYYSHKGGRLVDIMNKLIDENKFGYPPQRVRKVVQQDILYFSMFEEGSNLKLASGGLIDININKEEEKEEEGWTIRMLSWKNVAMTKKYLLHTSVMDSPSFVRHECAYVLEWGELPNATFPARLTGGGVESFQISWEELVELSQIKFTPVKPVLTFYRLKNPLMLPAEEGEKKWRGGNKYKWICYDLVKSGGGCRYMVIVIGVRLNGNLYYKNKDR